MIKCNKNIIVKTQNEFYATDKIVMGFAFDIHNTIGRFCDEKIYQRVLANKCENASMKADCEVEVVLTCGNFIKVYKLDLLVDNGVIYELKTVKSLNDIHKQQLINYLMITGIKHGKLINFRSGSVEFEFVSTSLTKKDRYNYFINTDEWKKITPKCEELKNIVCDLLTSWGSFLERELYNEALIHFLGGNEKVIFPVEIYFNNQVVGKQKMGLLNEDTTFHLSAITRAFKGYEKNIRLLIEHTKIKAVQWINLAHHEITFKTIKKV